MPPIETFHRHQKAVYWERIGTDEQGEPIIDDPIELDVRWEKKKSQALMPQGQTISIDATIVVDRDLVEGSLIWEGGLEDIPGTSLVPESNLLEIITFEKIPDVKGRKFRRRVGVIRFNNSLPGS